MKELYHRIATMSSGTVSALFVSDIDNRPMRVRGRAFVPPRILYP